MYLDEAVAATARFEPRVHWMYLDSLGRVNIGVNFVLESANEAATIPFCRANASPADASEIEREYETVLGFKAGLVPSAYRRSDSLLLPDEAINGLLRVSLSQCRARLRRLFPEFASFPEEAKVALLDMHFTLGNEGLKNGYRAFTAAVTEQDWSAALLLSLRSDESISRNGWTQQMLSTAGLVADTSRYAAV